ncbi:protein tyrosine phosphatase, partial [Dickeya dianthicola]
QQVLPGKTVVSAGWRAMAGKPADETASQVAAEHGLSLDGHVARQLTGALCRHYELILVMEKAHIDAVCRFSPEVRGKTLLFGHWLNQQEITDPYRKSREAFEFVYTQLEQSARKWAQALSR